MAGSDVRPAKAGKQKKGDGIMLHSICANCKHTTPDGLCAVGMCAVVRSYRRGARLEVPDEPVRVLIPTVIRVTEREVEP